MTLTLQEYCDKHGYVVISEYRTSGEEKIDHHRAIVEKIGTRERFTLYYDTTRRTKHKIKTNDPRGHYWYDSCFTQRGWRNTTLDNRRTTARINKQHESLTLQFVENNSEDTKEK